MVRIRGVASIVVDAPRADVERAVEKRRQPGSLYAVQQTPTGVRVVLAESRGPTTFLQEVTWRLRPDDLEKSVARELKDLKLEIEASQ
ncbi:MAG: hypothetical protein ACYDCK_08395 [Thermoplasmatota archaeon]